MLYCFNGSSDKTIYQLLNVHNNNNNNGSDSEILALQDISNTDLSIQLYNETDLNLNNITDCFLKSSLWPALQLHNWRKKDAGRTWQAEYILIVTLCVLALIINIISISAVSHIKHLLTTHLKLIINLGISDILISLSVLVHTIHKIYNSTTLQLPIGISEPNSRLTQACFFASLNSFTIMSLLIALLTLLAMAVDHYIAIMKPYKYPYIMSRRRGYVLITAMWTLAVIGGLSNFLIGTATYKTQKLFNFCEYIMNDDYHAEFLVLGITIICLFAITFIYTRIFFEVRRIQVKMPSVPNCTLHHKKALITTLVIIGTFIICWLPNCLFQLALIIEINLNRKTVHKLFSTFLILSKYLYIMQLANCLLDPIIYAVRLKMVQKGYKNFLKRVQNNLTSIKFHQVRFFLNQLCQKDSRMRKTRQNQCTKFDHTSDIILGDQNSNNMSKAWLHSESDKQCKLSDESDINDNELSHPFTTCENISMNTLLNTKESSLSCEVTFPEYIPMVTVHQTENAKSIDCNGALLLDNQNNGLIDK